jgi:hypothetical protein
MLLSNQFGDKPVQLIYSIILYSQGFAQRSLP